MKTDILIGLYVVMHIVMGSNYVPTPEPSETVKLLAASQWFIPTLMLVYLVPRVNKWATPVAEGSLWPGVIFIMVAGCIVLQLLGIPGLWWAWSTLGLLLLIIMSVVNRNVTRLGSLNAWLLGVMVMLLGMGSWEAIYQTGLLFYHDFFGSDTVNYVIVMAEQLTWIIPALIVILVLYKRYGNYVSLERGALVCIGVSVVCTTIWFANGMDIPLVWYQGPEGIVGPFVNANADPVMLSVSRGSQGFWLLGTAMLFRKEAQHV